MDPATTLVAALATGALAATQDTTKQIVKDAYEGLKKLIAPKLSSFARLAESPESASARKAAVEEASEKKLDEDETILAQLKALAAALSENPPERLPEGIRLEDVQAAGHIRIAHNRGSIDLTRTTSATGSIEIIGNLPK